MKLDGISNLIMDFDRQRLQQVVLNLVKNAIKFSHVNGGNVIISAKIKTKNSSLITFAKQIEVSVQDRGLGLYDSQRVKVFKPFFTC